MASPRGRPSQGPRQQPAVVGAALGGLSGALPCSPSSTRPHAPRPEGKKLGGPQGLGMLFRQGAPLWQRGSWRSGVPVSEGPMAAHVLSMARDLKRPGVAPRLVEKAWETSPLS